MRPIPGAVLVLVVLALAAGPLAAQQPKEEKKPYTSPLLRAQPIQLGARDDEVRKLLKARYNEAVAEIRAAYREAKEVARGDDYAMFDSAQRLLESGLEVHEQPADQIKLLELFIEFSRDSEKRYASLVADKVIAYTDAPRVRYYRLDAEIRLLRLRQKLKNP